MPKSSGPEDISRRCYGDPGKVRPILIIRHKTGGLDTAPLHRGRELMTEALTASGNRLEGSRCRFGSYIFPVFSSLLLLIILMVTPAFAQAEQPQTGKIELLLDLLDDQDVKVWLESRKDALEAGAKTGAAAPATNGGRGMMSTALEQVAAHLAYLASSWQLLPRHFAHVRETVLEDVDERGGLTLLALIILFVGIGSTATYATYLLVLPLRRWTIARDRETASGRLAKFAGRFLVGLLMLGAFTVGSAGAFLLFDWPPLLREIVLAYLSAAIATWAVSVVARVMLLPKFMGVERAREVRAFDIGDDEADHWYLWINTFAVAVSVAVASASLLPRFGLTTDDVLALVVLSEFLFLCIALLAVWMRPDIRRPVPEPGQRVRHKAGAWLITGYLVLLFVIRLGGAQAAFWLMVASIATPLAMVLSTHLVRYILRPAGNVTGERGFPLVTVAVIDRAVRLLIIVVAAYLVVRAWDLDMEDMAASNPRMTVILRGLLSAAVVALGADFLWAITKAVIQHKIGAQPPLETLDGVASPILDPHDARLRTLLPILQNIILAAIIVMTVLTILSSIGIQIGPLIAGAGVVGVAVGFGAQTIVKDVIAGVFYLLDDAFRIGEHISTGSFSGTVESFSLRSVKLRHHRGSIYTIPFGELGAVQNGSRDWTMDKFDITVGFDTDLELARRLIKNLGLELAEDPEYRAWVIEPIKLQGVQAFGEYGIVLRIKTTTRPGGAFDMKRAFLLRIRELFKENGIEIPVPTVHISGRPIADPHDGADSDAIAARAYLQRKKSVRSPSTEADDA